MITFMIFSVMVVYTNEARGPHHPRGQTIVKHHVHYRPTKNSNAESIMQDEQLLHDTAHIEEHLEEELEKVDLSKMSEEELEFYYFHVHDTDRNTKLDGLEILQALQHTDHNFEYGLEQVAVEEDTDFLLYVDLIDRVLNEDDTNHDGYISYPEYVAGRKKDQQTQPPFKGQFPEISDASLT